MKISVEDMIENHFAGDRKLAALAAGITVAFLNNMVSQKRDVLLLDNGNFILESKKAKIFNKKNNNACVI